VRVSALIFAIGVICMVALLDTVYDPAAHRLTFTWERK
jgi:hypothetical protein